MVDSGNVPTKSSFELLKDAAQGRYVAILVHQFFLQIFQPHQNYSLNQFHICNNNWRLSLIYTFIYLSNFSVGL